MRRHRLSDSDVEALVSGHTPPQRPDLAPIASFLRELPGQLSESEPIELAAPPRRRIRLLVAVAASTAAVLALAGLVALRSGDGLVRPAVGGPAVATTATAEGAGASESTVVAPVTAAPPATDASAAPPATAAQTPAERYVAAVLAWDQCVSTKSVDACGPAPDPAAFGLSTPTTPASTPANPPPSAATQPSSAPGSSTGT